MVRIALGVEYDGAGFHGWQSQPGGATVQDQLEQALARIAGHPVRTVCAGRTDAGVHALGQVAHFDTPAARPDSAWVRGVNAHLPAAIAVRWAQPVAEDFHARYSALSRRYIYWLLNRPVRPALLSHRVGWSHHALDAALMHSAAQQLIGEHDFSAFRAAECQAKSPVRHLFSLDITRTGDMICFAFCANAFLQHMVRNIVGSLVAVGQGRQAPEWIAEVLASRLRRHAAPTFSPAGLYFSGVDYAAHWRLPQAERIIPAFLSGAL